MIGYIDSNWATCRDTRQSTTGWMVQSSGSPSTYASKRQKIMAQSIQEAEYVVAPDLSNKIVWI
jgi:hypothetical protein